jgi:LPS-assembly protein
MEADVSRVIPKLDIKFGLPLIKQGKKSKSLLEPMVSFTAVPNKVNDDRIPNEDSLDIDFDDTKVFGGNRFNGYDVVENGSRFNYGINYKAYGQSYGQISTFIGQEYRLEGADVDVDNYGLDYGFSDYVGRLLFEPNTFFKVNAQYRADSKTLHMNRLQIGTYVGSDFVNVVNNYLYYDNYDLGNGEYVQREEISSTLNWALNKNWKLYVTQIYDLENRLDVLLGGGISYTDNCATFGLKLLRKYTEDRDYQGENFIMFTINLRTLGKFETGFIGMDNFVDSTMMSNDKSI